MEGIISGCSPSLVGENLIISSGEIQGKIQYWTIEQAVLQSNQVGVFYVNYANTWVDITTLSFNKTYNIIVFFDEQRQGFLGIEVSDYNIYLPAITNHTNLTADPDLFLANFQNLRVANVQISYLNGTLQFVSQPTVDIRHFMYREVWLQTFMTNLYPQLLSYLKVSTSTRQIDEINYTISTTVKPNDTLTFVLSESIELEKNLKLFSPALLIFYHNGIQENINHNINVDGTISLISDITWQVGDKLMITGIFK